MRTRTRRIRTRTRVWERFTRTRTRTDTHTHTHGPCTLPLSCGCSRLAAYVARVSEGRRGRQRVPSSPWGPWRPRQPSLTLASPRRAPPGSRRRSLPADDWLHDSRSPVPRRRRPHASCEISRACICTCKSCSRALRSAWPWIARATSSLAVAIERLVSPDLLAARRTFQLPLFLNKVQAWNFSKFPRVFNLLAHQERGPRHAHGALVPGLARN